MNWQERLDRYTDKSGECWRWTGGTRKGYGRVRLHRKDISAHRLAYELANGPLPDGHFVCHHCDNPLCVRPDHLFLGTPAQNTNDMMAKGRNARGVKSNTAKLDENAVRSIRSLYSLSGLTGQDIARMYGVSSQVVYGILNGKGWTHVT